MPIWHARPAHRQRRDACPAPDLPGKQVQQVQPGRTPDLRVHPRDGPEAITAYNVVLVLWEVILARTMVLMTVQAMTRERERGTFENPLSTPATPLEIFTVKIIPYLVIDPAQVSLILLTACWIFNVLPLHGTLVMLYAVVLLFTGINLTLGISFTSIARNQLQTMQMTFFFSAVRAATPIHVPVARHAPMVAGGGQPAHAFHESSLYFVLRPIFCRGIQKHQASMHLLPLSSSQEKRRNQCLERFWADKLVSAESTLR